MVVDLPESFRFTEKQSADLEAMGTVDLVRERGQHDPCSDAPSWGPSGKHRAVLARRESGYQP
jgi:hypothetical protein